MRVSDVFPSEFLKSDDLGGVEANRRVPVTIADVKIWEDAQGNRKFSIGFEKARKRLLANKTNARTIAKAYGEESNDWIGKQIILYVAMVQFMDEMVPAVRVAIPTKQTAAVPLSSPPTNSAPLEPSSAHVQHGVINPAPPVDNPDVFGLPSTPNELNDDIPF